jgi:hypothetical protein
MTDTAPRFISIVNKSQAYDKVRRAVLDKIEGDFTDVEKATTKAEKCREIYTHSMTFSFEDWVKDESPDMGAIKALFVQFTAWEDLLVKSIEGRKNCGMIQLYGAALKESLAEKLLLDKDKLRSYLYKIATESVADIRNQILKIQKNLATKPHDLVSFVQYVKDLREA